MARSATSSRAASKPKPDASTIQLEDLEPDFVGLISCAYNVSPTSPEKEELNTLDCLATLVDDDEQSKILLVVEFRALRYAEDEGTAFMSAQYVASAVAKDKLLVSSEEVRRYVAENFIKFTVWQNFRNLTPIISGQSVMRLKPLPMSVGSIRWLSYDNFEKETIKIPIAQRAETKKKKRVISNK